MSARRQQQQRTQMYCKICFDCGKAKAMYTSHNTRDGGKVVCPTLLATECQYCKKKGHTIKYCPTLKDKENGRMQPQQQCTSRQQSQQQRREVSTATQEVPKAVNMFEILAEGDINRDCRRQHNSRSDETSHCKGICSEAMKLPNVGGVMGKVSPTARGFAPQQVVEDFPALPTAPQTQSPPAPQRPAAISYASILAKPVEIDSTKTRALINSMAIPPLNERIACGLNSAKTAKPLSKDISWAMMSDSDYESDYGDNCDEDEHGDAFYQQDEDDEDKDFNGIPFYPDEDYEGYDEEQNAWREEVDSF